MMVPPNCGADILVGDIPETVASPVFGRPETGLIMRRILARFLPALPVRIRILLIAVIPVVGFFFNSLAYRAGENAVERAFANSRRATALAETSGELKSAIAIMRMSASELAFRPSRELLEAFEATYRRATVETAKLVRLLDGAALSRVKPLQRSLAGVIERFRTLKAEQNKLDSARAKEFTRA